MLLPSTILALAAIIGFNSAVQAATTVPDGAYLVTTFANDTQLYKSLSDSSLAPIVVERSAEVAPEPLAHSAKFSRSALAKRRVDCWGYQLDQTGVDVAAQQLAETCGNGLEIKTEPDRTVALHVLREGMIAYYCVNSGGKTGNCDRDDVRYAFYQMDLRCRRYEASWFGWPGSFEIVGKAREGDVVCTGGMNNVPF